MKIGIITLHKVINYGSVLQAYALQKYIQNQFGENADVEIIDYIYPNKFHEDKDVSVIKKIRAIGKYCLDHTIRKCNPKILSFNTFYRRYLNLSAQRYSSYASIHDNPPIYDLYITGSDQVWNPRTLKGDSTLYCSFAPKGSRKIAFAASFTENTLPDPYYSIAKNELSTYSHIGVRENSSLKILEELHLPLSITTMCTCDPTLLLSADDYAQIAKNSKLKIEGKYILIYYLGYAYNPQPAMSLVVEQVVKNLGYQVILIGEKNFEYKGNVRSILKLGIAEYLSLFQNAEYVVTSSFHGTMFSLINKVPFYSIVPKADHKDSRTKDILSILGLGHRGIAADSNVLNISLDNPFNAEVIDKFNNYIEKSKKFLNEIINI